MTFKFSNTEKEFSFYFSNNLGQLIPVSDWNELQSDYLSQLAILNELVDNGSALLSEECCIVSNENTLQISSLDKQILELPRTYPYDILIESEGVLTANNFKFKYGFYDFSPNGNRLNAIRKGSIVQLNGASYILTYNQYQICESIEEFNSLPDAEKGNVVNLKKLSELKGLSKESGLTLEHFLNNQELYIPEKIKLDIDYNNGILEIFPAIEIENPNSFINTFDKLPTVRDVYPISNNNATTTRVVISENQKKELQKVKGLRKVSNQEQIQNIIEHPELYFDEPVIDFTIFYSDRVKEIGVYSPKFYPFASPYKSQWIPGIIIKDKIHGEKRIYFKSPESLNDFIFQKEKAVKENQLNVIWEGAEIPVEEAENFIKKAIKQFENPNTPIKKERPTDNEVLIIKENAVLTEFTNSNEIPDNLKHNFYEITNLRSGINLKEHQKEGISWLQSLFRGNFTGGLLADDMGLGKTLQLLYFIEWHSQHYNDNKPYLIVAPISLLENWENEYQKFFSPQNIPLCKLYGSTSMTKENSPIHNQQDAKRLQFKQIILTNYETLRMYQISLGLIDFSVIALDEAQKIKTPGTLITNACKALKADFKIAMTGTPVENTLVDIWCILDYAVPGLLGNAKDFAKVYQNPLKDEKTDVIKLTEQLRNNIGIFIKRRYKKDVIDLPKKHDNDNSRIKKVMPTVQLERYKSEIEQANDSELEGINKRNQKLKSLWAIRDISDHPYLLENDISKINSDELIRSSSKLQTTIGILEDIKSKQEKVILFADRKETQKMLQKVIYESFGIFSSIINGDTPTKKVDEGKSNLSRQQTIDRFQNEEGFNTIIMSPIAAGVGLNVTAANHIIHFTRHWNPAKEAQATDRAYRIGQLKDVFVYYPMAIFPDEMIDENGKKMKSFDEVLDNLLKNKTSLASNALFPTEQAEITPDELFDNIFGTKTVSTPKPLSLSDIDRIHPNLFEASIGMLFKKQGFEIHLTPYSNDKGVDVVALKNGENYLIQVKQTKSTVGNDAIQEICAAKKYYESRFNENFNLLTITNSEYTSTAELLAKSNEIKLIRRSQLEQMVNTNKITIQEINKLESQRMVKF